MVQIDNQNIDVVNNKTVDYEKKFKKLKKVVVILSFALISILTLFFYLKGQFVITDNFAIVGFSFSIVFVIIVLGFLFGTGIGQDIYKRFKNKLLFKSGNFVNVLYVSKNGVIKEVFSKVDDITGSFKVRNKSMTRNPSLLYRYKGMPTYIHREGNPDPIDPFSREYTTEISEAEIDQVMESKNSFDFRQWLNENKMYIFIALIAIVAVGAVSAFFGYRIEQMLTEGTYKAISCVKDSVALNASSPTLVR